MNRLITISFSDSIFNPPLPILIIFMFAIIYLTYKLYDLISIRRDP